MRPDNNTTVANALMSKCPYAVGQVDVDSPGWDKSLLNRLMFAR